jgi:hypothetical protein
MTEFLTSYEIAGKVWIFWTLTIICFIFHWVSYWSKELDKFIIPTIIYLGINTYFEAMDVLSIKSLFILGIYLLTGSIYTLIRAYFLGRSKRDYVLDEYNKRSFINEIKDTFTFFMLLYPYHFVDKLFGSYLVKLMDFIGDYFSSLGERLFNLGMSKQFKKLDEMNNVNNSSIDQGPFHTEKGNTTIL